MRILACCAVVFIGLIAPAGVFFAVAFLYALRWFGIELLLVAVLYDAVFLVGEVPLYSLVILGLLATVEWCRPALSVY